MEIMIEKRIKYAQDVFKELTEKAGFPLDQAANFLNNIPDADAEPVVRCRECVHCLLDELNKDKKGRCMEHHLWCEADGFCHKGEKMDGGAENGL